MGENRWGRMSPIKKSRVRLLDSGKVCLLHPKKNSEQTTNVKRYFCLSSITPHRSFLWKNIDGEPRPLQNGDKKMSPKFRKSWFHRRHRDFGRIMTIYENDNTEANGALLVLHDAVIGFPWRVVFVTKKWPPSGSTKFVEFVTSY